MATSNRPASPAGETSTPSGSDAFPDDVWLYAGHESEVRGDGAFRRRTVGGRPLFLVRGRDGEVRVFFNTCTHRGALVCRQDHGQARSFQCFYHAWTFDSHGELVGIPGQEAYGPGWRSEELGLRSPAGTAEYRGFYFVSFDPTAPALEEQLGDGARELDRVVERAPGGLRAAAGRERFVVSASWRAVLDAAAGGRAPDGARQVCPNLLLYPREAVTVCRVEPRAERTTELDTVLLLTDDRGDAAVREALRSAREAGPAGLSLLGQLEDLETRDDDIKPDESRSE